MSVSRAVSLAKNRNLRMAAVEAMPGRWFSRVYNSLTDRHTHLFQTENGFWVLRLPHRIVKMVRPHDAVRFTHIGDNPERRVYDNYTIVGGFEPKPGDVVVDVGAYLGEFSWWVQEHCDPAAVIAVDPDPRSMWCLYTNLTDNREIKQAVVGESDGETTITVADDPSESGVLPPDVGCGETLTVEQRRLDSLVDSVDYLKVEAEGYEPEVLAGLGELQPGKVAVDVSPERDGESPARECTAILHDRGYATKRDGKYLFAWQV